MVSLTGSTGTGKKIMATAANTLKRRPPGTRRPVLVFDDADPTRWRQGQLCRDRNTGQGLHGGDARLAAERSRYNDAVESLVEAMRAGQGRRPLRRQHGHGAGHLRSSKQTVRLHRPRCDERGAHRHRRRRARGFRRRLLGRDRPSLSTPTSRRRLSRTRSLVRC